MSSIKKLRILTPVTTDGKTLAYDKDKQPIYTESFAENTAKKDLENLNTHLPEHLRHKLEEVDVIVSAKVEVVEKSLFEDAQKTIEEKSTLLKECEDGLTAKDEKIAALEKQLAEVNKEAPKQEASQAPAKDANPLVKK